MRGELFSNALNRVIQFTPVVSGDALRNLCRGKLTECRSDLFFQSPQRFGFRIERADGGEQVQHCGHFPEAESDFVCPEIGRCCARSWGSLSAFGGVHPPIGILNETCKLIVRIGRR